MIKIIIVDDEMLARVGIRSLLDKHSDLRVEDDFDSAQDAIDYLRKHREIDIVITDIEMPGINGLEMIHQILDEGLALSVIILSCHESFKYAKEAISAGADAYILKQNISEDQVIATIHDVMKKKKRDRFSNIDSPIDIENKDLPIDSSVFYVCVLRFVQYNADPDYNQVNLSMLEHLIENVVKTHKIGTLFVPYRKDMFVLMQFPLTSKEKENHIAVKEFCDDLNGNMETFVNRAANLGVSKKFTDIKEIRYRYDEALSASKLGFYISDKHCWYKDEMGENPAITNFEFSSDGFLNEGGVGVFRNELHQYLIKCRDKKLDVDYAINKLKGQIEYLIWNILHEYDLHQDISQEWNSKVELFIDTGEDYGIESIESGISEIMSQFQTEVLTLLKNDDFQKVIQYINENIEKKLSLNELADMNYMSTTSFCRKIKEKTGMTLVHYINMQKINHVKCLLQDRTLSLEVIAQKVGFMNVNYMIRVFKKITGETVSDYRRSINEVNDPL